MQSLFCNLVVREREREMIVFVKRATGSMCVCDFVCLVLVSLLSCSG